MASAISRIITAEDTAAWRGALSRFARVDIGHMPEYHAAYATRVKGARALLWVFEQDGHTFACPFFLTPAGLGTNYKDISGVYGYSGPLATTPDKGFLRAAWGEFDGWVRTENIIAEFTRFSPYADNRHFAHPDTEILANRALAVSHLPKTEAEFLAALDKKTRNMIRKAEKANLVVRECDIETSLDDFRRLYAETMDRNTSPEFFYYDDAYYAHLKSLAPGEFRLFGVYDGARMVAGAIALVHGGGALYHLGASLPDYAAQGANNLCLYAMNAGLIRSGVEFINMTGGRTTAPDDPLLRFKKSNATGEETFYIGKRIVDPAGYAQMRARWAAEKGTAPDPQMLIFYR